jgi:hypothetical protein
MHVSSHSLVLAAWIHISKLAALYDPTDLSLMTST